MSDYSKLVEAGVNTKVAAELCTTFHTGKLQYEDLDLRAIDAFCECPVNDAIEILKEFSTTMNLDHVKNKSAYLCGMMKTQHQKSRQQGGPKGGKQQRGVSPGRQVKNKGGPRPNMGPPPQGNQMPRMRPLLMPQLDQGYTMSPPQIQQQLNPGPGLLQWHLGNQSFMQPGNPTRYGQQGNQGYGQQGNRGYGQQGNQGFGGPGNQQFGGPGNQGYGVPGNQGYGGPGNQGYGGPGNPGYGGPGNQGYGGPGNMGNQGFGGQGNQGYGGPGNPGYGGPGNQGYGGPGNMGNQGFGGQGNQGYGGPGYQGLGPGNRGFGGPPNNGGFRQPDSQEGSQEGICDSHDQQKSKEKAKKRQRKKQNQGNSDQRNNDDSKEEVDDGFAKLKSLLSEEPGHQDHDTEDNPQNHSRGRGRGGRGRGRGKGRDGQRSQCQEQDNSHQQQSDDSETSGYDDEGSQYGSKANLSNDNRGRGRRRKAGNRGRGNRGRGGQNGKNSEKGKTWMPESEKGGKKQNEEKRVHEIEDGNIPDVDDGIVFKFMIKTFGGGCSYEDFWKKCDLFPLDSNIPAWFRKHSRRFHVFWEPKEGQKKIVYLIPFYRDVKICTKYNNRKSPGNCGESCEFFHVCRRFVRGNCRNKDCPLSHSFKNHHNNKLKHKLGIDDFTDADIKVVLNCNTPSVCTDYIYGNACKVPDSEKRCPYLHLCRDHVFGKCTEKCKYKKIHSIEQFHNKWVLVSCHMKGWQQQRVFKNIYVPPRPIHEMDDSTDDSDLSQDEDDKYDGGTVIYDSDLCNSYESLSSTISDRSRSMRNLGDSMNSLEIDTGSKKGPPPSRKNRFKSTGNIIGGIVGKDDKNLSSSKHYDDDDENTKEREQLMMEKWKLDKYSGKSYDEDDNIIDMENMAMEEWLRSQQRSRSSSNDIPVKLKAPPKPSKFNPSDPNYEERDQSLLKEDSDSTNICFYLTKEKCKVGTCKNYHLLSGVPYLWQLKMFGKWMSFTSSENEKIEEAFCKLQDVVSTEMPYQRMRYSCHIHFPNQKAIIYDVDGQTASDGESSQGCNIRRLSTPSFAEKKMTVPCYLTQWRWYWSDDNRKWNIYDKDVFQFTMEKKFLTKQKAYLFSRDNFYFMYKMDFQDFTQTNLDTKKIRKILRRPSFVSRDDIKNQKCPETIPFPTATTAAKPMHFNTWDCAHDFELVDLDQSGREYKDVLKSFHNSMDQGRFQVKYVYRIQNRKLWSEYDTKKKHMIADAEQEGQGQNVDERDLFHGTDSLNTCRGICTNNFDFRISGRNATLYGEGSYFAVRAKIGHSYTEASSPREVRFLFRAKVLVGQYTKGHPSFKRPPTIPGKSHKLFDSCVNEELDPTIFVVFDRNQCYPDYLFMYTDNETIPPAQTSHDLIDFGSHDLQSLINQQSSPLVYPQHTAASTEQNPPGSLNPTGTSSVRNPSTAIPLKYKEADSEKRDESCSIQ